MIAMVSQPSPKAEASERHRRHHPDNIVFLFLVHVYLVYKSSLSLHLRYAAVRLLQPRQAVGHAVRAAVYPLG